MFFKTLRRLHVGKYRHFKHICLLSSTSVKQNYTGIQRSSSHIVRAVKLKISWEEWDYCFNFSFLEVLDFVKDV